jgi:hypothetical protein
MKLELRNGRSESWAPVTSTTSIRDDNVDMGDTVFCFENLDGTLGVGGRGAVNLNDNQCASIRWLKSRKFFRG